MRIGKIFSVPRWLKLTLKTFAIAIVSLVLIVMIALNTSFVQKPIIELATELLSKQLNTKVEIDEINVNLITQQVSIHKVRIQDQNKREMLLVKEIWGNFRLLPLLRGQVVLKEFKIDGVKVLLSKPENGPANYQFLLDSTKKKDKKKKKKKNKPSAFVVELANAKVNNIQVTYNGMDYILEKAEYSDWRDKRHVNIQGLHFKTDNHKPRKNTNKPHRGFFDAGHLDMVANLGVDISHISKDTIRGAITNCIVTDSITGFYIHDVCAGITYSNKNIHLSDINVYQLDTHINIPKADFALPDKKLGTKLKYKADSIYVRTFLKDISRPFAPVLKNFSIPLNVRCSLIGNPKGMFFRGIHVNTDDNKLVINSTGVLRNMKGKELNLHFEVYDMVAKPGIKDKIINQFPVKKHMMYQIYALGVVKYHGSFDILWRKEQFRGILNTEKGDIDFEFQIDDNNKYLSGRVNSDSLQLGDLFKLKKLHEISASATFNVDISKPRTAERRKEKGGKLPFGTIQADIRKVNYKGLLLKNIHANIESDGAEAKGDITLMGSLTDLMLEFSFTDTEAMQEMKAKPRLRYRHLVSDN